MLGSLNCPTYYAKWVGGRLLVLYDSSRLSLGLKDSSRPSLGLNDSIRPSLGLNDSICPSLGLNDSSRPSLGLNDSSRPSLGLNDSSRSSLDLNDSSHPSLGLNNSSRPSLGLSDSSRPSLGLSDSSRPSLGLSDSGRPSLDLNDYVVRLVFTVTCQLFSVVCWCLSDLSPAFGIAYLFTCTWLFLEFNLPELCQLVGTNGTLTFDLCPYTVIQRCILLLQNSNNIVVVVFVLHYIASGCQVTLGGNEVTPLCGGMGHSLSFNHCELYIFAACVTSTEAGGE